MGLQLQVLLLIGTASLLHAACPYVPVIGDFSTSKFGGVWFWTEWYNTGWLSAEIPVYTNCLATKYTPTGGGDMSVTTVWKNMGSLVGRGVSGSLVARSSPNHFTARSQAPTPVPQGKLYVLDIVYNTYAVVYTCTDVVLGGHIETAWILNRKDTGLTNRQRNKLIKRFKENNLGFIVDPTKFVPFDQSGCENYRKDL